MAGAGADQATMARARTVPKLVKTVPTPYPGGRGTKANRGANT